MKPLGALEATEIYRSLQLLNDEILAYGREQHGGLCSVTLKPTAGGKGTTATGTATFDGDKWRVDC